MSEVKLNDKQIAALRWGIIPDGEFPTYRRWSGLLKRGNPSYATMSAMVRRGLMEQVGMKTMDLYRTTSAGRAAIASMETDGGGEHG